MATTENGSDENHESKTTDKAEGTQTETSGDPGRTPGSAEGDEETIDEDIREKEAEGKL